MDIKTDDYHIWQDPASATVYLQGFLRLDGMEAYKPVMELMLDSIDPGKPMTIHLRELEFLNSSGISMLSMFVVKVRERGDVQLVFQGSDKILWQTKSLKNLQRLMPSLTLELA